MRSRSSLKTAHLLVDRGETPFCGQLSDKHLRRVLGMLAEFRDVHAVVCGPRTAGMLDSSPAAPEYDRARAGSSRPVQSLIITRRP